MMNKQKILSQLRDLAWHCESMADPFEKDNIWLRDMEALHKAAEYVEKYMRDDEVERQPKTAHWADYKDEVLKEINGDRIIKRTFKCSRCSEWALEKAKYCPHCGAEMTEKTTEEAENES